MEHLTKYYRKHSAKHVKVIHYNAGLGALDNKRYSRRRDEMWHKYGRKWLANPRCCLLDAPGLKRQLTAPQFEERNNVIYVESKKSLKSRGFESTNLADALLQTLMVHLPATDLTEQEPPPDHTHSVFYKHFNRLKRQKESNGFIR